MGQFLILATIFCAVNGFAKEDWRSNVTWIGARGERLNINWRVASRWRWPQSPDLSQFVAPVLQHWIEVPLAYELEQVKLTTGQRVPSGTPPFPLAPGHRWVSARTQKSVAKGTLKVKHQGVRQHIGFFLQPKKDRTFLWLDPNCSDYGIEVSQANPLNSNLSYLAVHCVIKDKKLVLWLSHPRMKMKGTISGSVGHAPGRTRLQIDRLEKGVARLIGKVSFGQGRFLIRFRWPPERRAFFAKAFLGTSYLAYTELPDDTRVGEASASAGLTVAVPLKKKVSAELETNYSRFSFFRVEKGRSEPSLLLASLRLRWFSPMSWGSYRLSFVGGVGLFKMFVPAADYGVSSLWGSEFGVRFAREIPFVVRRRWLAVRFMPTGGLPGTTGPFSFRATMQLGLQLNSSNASREFDLVGEYSYIRAATAGVFNEVRASFVRLGVQLRLY